MSNTHGTEVQMLVLVKQRNLPLFDKRTEMTFRTLTHLIPTEKLIFSFCHLRLTDQISQRNFHRLGLFPSWLLPCHEQGKFPVFDFALFKSTIWSYWPYLKYDMTIFVFVTLKYLQTFTLSDHEDFSSLNGSPLKAKENDFGKISSMMD